jgi:prepilin-type N-terminal cleavage/methylation domain-containing protein
MKRQTGFTLIELMMVFVILGILGATSVGFLAKYRQRTIGSEAVVMLKQILEGEIIYFLAHNEFFPRFGEPDIWVWDNGALPSLGDQQRALNNLSVAVPIGHKLDFHVWRDPDPSNPTGSPVTVEITSAGNFNLFPGAHRIKGTVDKDGRITGPTAF